MTTLHELFNLIQKTLKTQGFKSSEYFNNTYEYAQFTLNNELQQKQLTSSVEYKVLSGLSLEIRECPRRNGSKQDVSYYLAIEEWERSSGHDVKKIKLQRYQTEATIIRKVNKFALEYKQYLEDKMFEKAFEQFFKDKAR